MAFHTVFYAVEKVLLEREGNYVERSMDIKDKNLRFYSHLNDGSPVHDDDILFIDCLKITKVAHVYTSL